MFFTISFGGNDIPATNREHKGRSLIAFPSDYCVIDLETTGRSPLWDRIIEVGILQVIDGAIVDTYQTLVKPHESDDMHYISHFIEKLTGITNEMLDTAPLFSEVCHDIVTFIGNSVLVGYNVHFDVNFLYDAFMENMGTPLKNDFIDVLRMARKLHPELSHHRLKDMCDLFEVNSSGAHRSIRDCEMTQQCFARLKSESLDRFGSEKAFYDTFKNHGRNKHGKGVRSKDIIADPIKLDTDNLLYGKNCVITGKLEKMTRKEAMQLIADIGGINQDNVTKRTNYLILGNNDYCSTIKDGKSNKQKKAEEYILEGQDIEVIPETVFYDMIGDMIADSAGGEDQNDTFVLNSYVFGGCDPDTIYRSILDMTGEDEKNIVLKLNKTGTSIFMFGSLAFSIRINSRTQCLDTKIDAARDYVDRIDGASYSNETYHFPIATTPEACAVVTDMVNAVCNELREAVTGIAFGCCNDFILCSDALRCLKAKDPEYNGCQYRKNLEAGRIFYGKNRNVD